ncbi:MAG: globin [Acidobacteria bacterium]|jgi:hemoglobin-like flavoprotein|nr:globin [Acidobacteriota bacterium]
MDKAVLEMFDGSLGRCTSQSRFLDLFYAKFLASSPKVREKFKDTDFVRQKRALKASLHMILLAAGDESGDPGTYLSDVAEKHNAKHLDVGAELYDLWLDSLLETVEECDPEYSAEVRQAWEEVMMVGIHYLTVRYNA